MKLDRDHHPSRLRRRRQLLTALAVLVTATFVAGPAAAGDRHHRGGHYYRHHGGHHYSGYYPHHWGVRVLHHRSYPVYLHGGAGYANHEAGYYCGPCNQRFGSYDGLSNHVHHRHHVPLWKLPFVIIDSVLHGVVGWIFHG